MRPFLLVVAFFIIKSSLATTYYVSNISGNDTYTVTQAKNQSTPWKTLNKVNSITLQPGDSILFKRGESFQGSLTTRGTGLQGKIIEIFI